MKRHHQRGRRIRRAIGGLLLVLMVAGCTPMAAPPPQPTTVPTEVPSTATTAAPTATSAPTATIAEPTTAPAPTEATDLSAGIALYKANGCIGCHTLDAAGATGTVGPSHNGVGTTAATRIIDPDYTGSATTAEAYIRESIETPTAYTVTGFPEGVMPSFAGLPEEDKAALIAMLLAQQ